MDKIKKLEWENDKDYDYRLNTGEIIFVVASILVEIGTIEKNQEKFTEQKFREIKEKIKKQKNKLLSLIVPNKYTKVQNFLIETIQSYSKGIIALENGVLTKNSQMTYRASRYIREGNAWFELAKIRIWESIENAMKN